VLKRDVKLQLTELTEPNVNRTQAAERVENAVFISGDLDL